MDSRTAGELLATMQAAWPGFAADDVGNRMWLRLIAGVPREVARRAVRRMIDTIEFRPSVSQWQEACRTEVRRAAAAEPVEVLEVDVDREVGHTHIETMRTVLDEKMPPAPREIPPVDVSGLGSFTAPASYDDLYGKAPAEPPAEPPADDSSEVD